MVARARATSYREVAVSKPQRSWGGTWVSEFQEVVYSRTQPNISIVEKVKSINSGWKTTSLSLAGRVTLTRSVQQTIPSFVMQVVKLPVHACDDIEKLCLQFVWGEVGNRRKIHQVGGDFVTQPKERGGLSLRRLREFNDALLAKPFNL